MDDMAIVGARGSMDIDAAIKELKRYCRICQIFDASVICGKDHVIAAYNHAKRAFENGDNITKSIEMEMLLYVAAKRQINEAIKFAGAKEKGEYVIFMYGVEQDKAEKIVASLGLEVDNAVITPTLEKIKKFGITEKELKTVDKSRYAELVLEKMALLDVLK
ncbi:MAG: hypothetical protein J7K61_03030 [Thermoplasmata archaeon]|nr:hypothetical protein [Thermoplasmata archaeon]